MKNFTNELKSLLSLAILLIFSAFQLSFIKSNESGKPNIILILVDDMGFSDLGFMGSGIETPNIDKLAAGGVLLNHFYNTGRCAPTRASLLTGQYAHNTGLGWMPVSNLGHPGYTGDMNQQSITIAQVLKPAGYSTYMTGKLHTTYYEFMEPQGPKHNWPLQRGFDKFFGHLSGGGGYYSPKTLTYNNERLDVPDDFYLTTAVTDSTVSFLKQHFETKNDKPFFFYVAYYAPHRPLHALAEDIDKYRGKFMDGWDKERQKRYKKLKEIGIIDAGWKLTKREERVPVWDDLPTDEQKVWDALMATYAAQIDCMDQGIGEILSVLEKNDELDNTLIFFLSDNGGCAEEQGRRLSMEEIGLLGKEDPAQSYRINWANVSNTPFREYKHWVHEGGIATPMIMYWPEKIKYKGEITPQIGHVIDLMPTILDITGAMYPDKINGQTINPIQGKSLLPSLEGKIFERGPLFFEHEANRAVIDGEWKLVSKGTNKPPYTTDWELFNLKNDRTETNNLIEKYPQKASELKTLWENWAKKNNVYPLDGRGWNQKIEADKIK
jgi:arylsulfatase